MRQEFSAYILRVLPDDWRYTNRNISWNSEQKTSSKNVSLQKEAETREESAPFDVQDASFAAF